MTNFKYYKTRENAENAFRKILKLNYNETILGFNERFIDWLYQERNSIAETAYQLMREAMVFGFTTQTQANDRLHRFIEAMKCGEKWQNECAINLDKILDETWSIDSVRKAMTYAIYIIGKYNMTDVFKVLSDVEESHNVKSTNKDICKKPEDNAANYKH